MATQAVRDMAAARATPGLRISESRMLWYFSFVFANIGKRVLSSPLNIWTLMYVLN